METTPIDNAESHQPQSTEAKLENDGVNKNTEVKEVEELEEAKKLGKAIAEDRPTADKKEEEAEIVDTTVSENPASTEVKDTEEVADDAGGEEISLPSKSEEESLVEETSKEDTVEKEGNINDTVESHDGGESEIVRTATPGSRTSTPPPGSLSQTAPKKFSAVNVTKKFLSKTGQPAVTPATGSKLGLNASPVPIPSTSSRLLSTSLTTAPLAKSSASPNPPAPGVSPAASSSPWAKASASSETPSDPSSLQQPAPRRSLANLAETIGQGQGMGAVKPVAWKPVVPEGRSRMGMSREFPTTREIAEGESRIGKQIAEGKMQAQMAAQQQAAHNQALLKSLNAFTQVDSAHRWDEDDDDDDVIDFGDGIHLPTAAPPVEAPTAKSATYVADDFDRSWPRKAPVEVATKRNDEPRDRVLFNASSNRLEPSLPRQNAPPAPTRLMSRTSGEIPTRPPPSTSERQLPPHQQNPPQPQPGSRALPPHMANAQPDLSRPQPSSSRPAWGAPRTQEDGGSGSHPRPNHVSPQKTSSALPSRPTWEQQAHAAATQPGQVRRPSRSDHAPPPPPSQAAPSAQSSAPAGKVDEQTAEMHTAAERARLRRLAEEEERTAAKERAMRKAKELEERLGIKSAAAAPSPVAAAPVLPPATTQPTLMRRPVPPPTQTAPPPPPSGALGLSTAPALSPPIPKVEPSRQESSWRSRPISTSTDQPSAGPAPAVHAKPPLAQPKVDTILKAHARAEESLREAIQAVPIREAPPHTVSPPTAAPAPSIPAPVIPETVVRLPGQAILPESERPAGPKDDGLEMIMARISAAMAEARLAPPPISEVITPAPNQQTPSIPTQRSPPKPLPQPKPQSRPLFPEFFDVTNTQPPKSPPPAWRTFTVRLPSSHPSKSTLPPSQLKAAETPQSHPIGWLLVFQPPLDLPPNTIVADVLIARPAQQRFSKLVDSTPIVSISPRRLEPFERKKKKASSSPIKSMQPEIQPPSTAEHLIAPQSGSFGWQQSKAESSKWSSTTAPAITVQSALPQGETTSGLKSSRSPVKSSPAAKAEKDGHFAQEPVSVGPISRSRPVDVKSGVRFMVSSELEGDSLLDEVNKMSLETVGEGWGADEKGDVTKTPGSETPKTPPSLSATSSRNPTSPSGASTPWSRSTPRGTTQHDHLKSVWDHASDAPSTRTAPISDIPLPPPLISVPSQSTQSDISTPLYPSLNAPSPSTNIPSLPSTSPGFAQHNGFMRPPSGYAYHDVPSPTDSPDNYGSIAGRPNGGFSAPWSPAAFGASMPSTGYGYAGKQQQPQAGEKDAGAGHYGFSQAAFGQQQQQQQAYSQLYAQQQQNGYARGVGAGTYAYARYTQQPGASVGAQVRTGGRFPAQQQQPGSNGEYGVQPGSIGYGEQGYYAGIRGQGQQQPHPGQVNSPVYGQQHQQSHSPHPHPQQQHNPQNSYPQQQQQYTGAGAVGQQIMRGGRKVW